MSSADDKEEESETMFQGLDVEKYASLMKKAEFQTLKITLRIRQVIAIRYKFDLSWYFVMKEGWS